MERTKRNNEQSQAAAEGSTEETPQGDEEPSIKRAKGEGYVESGNASDLSAHDLLIQVAKVQLAAARKDEVQNIADNDVEKIGTMVFAGPCGAGASGSSSSSSSTGVPTLAESLQKCG